MLEQRQNILITGGTGSLGSALVARWYDDHNITVLSRDPHKQERMKAQYPRVQFVLADICNFDKVGESCHGQTVLIHAAALKTVHLGEAYPDEYARVNIEGSRVVARAWNMMRVNLSLSPLTLGIKRKALMIGTDKQVSPVNTYGMSKGMASSIFTSYGHSVIRYGNVVSSNGSFLQVWKSRIESGQPIIARNPNPTRFALSLDQAVDLVEDSLSQPPGIYIPHSLPAFSLADVVEVFRQRYDCKVQYEPLLKGEKQHEILLAEGERAERVSDLLAKVAHECNLRYEDRIPYHSATAPRLEREEVEAWLSS